MQYKALPEGLAAEWTAWLQSWAAAVLVEGDVAEVTARLRAVNPKYVPREWMLAEAYDKVPPCTKNVIDSSFEENKMKYDPGVFGSEI